MDYEELVRHCEFYAADIFVRALSDGKWQPVSIASLPFVDAMKCINQWHKDRHEPVRVLRNMDAPGDGAGRDGAAGTVVQ